MSEHRNIQREVKEQEESQFTLLGSVWANEDQEESTLQEENLEKLERYSYFDGKKIFASMKLPEESVKAGERLFEMNLLKIQEIRSGFSSLDGEQCGSMEATVGNGRDMFAVAAVFSHKKMIETRCRCPECRRLSWGWFSENPKCKYIAALGFYIRDYLQDHNFSDATDINGDNLLAIYQRNRNKAILTGKKEGQEETVSLVPRLTQKDNRLFVSFKVGTGKMFVVKKLDEFCRQVRNGETAQYGASTQISHRMDDFREACRKWILLIISRRTGFTKQRLDSWKKQSLLRSFPIMDSFIFKWGGIPCQSFITVCCQSCRKLRILQKKTRRNSGVILHRKRNLYFIWIWRTTM